MALTIAVQLTRMGFVFFKRRTPTTPEGAAVMMFLSMCSGPYAEYFASRLDAEAVQDPGFLHEVFLVQAQAIRVCLAQADLDARAASGIADAFGALWATFGGVLPRERLPSELRRALDLLKETQPAAHATMVASQPYLAPRRDDEEGDALYKDALQTGGPELLAEAFFRRYGMVDTSVSERVPMMFLMTVKNTSEHLKSLRFTL